MITAFRHVRPLLRPRLAALLIAAVALAAPMVMASGALAAESLTEAATNICIARGEKPGTPEFQACYEQVLVELTVMISDGLGE